VESEEVWMDLHALRRHGWSINALAREFHLNRRTVKRELAAEVPRRYPPRAPRHPFTPVQLAHIERQLAVCPSLRATDTVLVPVLASVLIGAFGYLQAIPIFMEHPPASVLSVQSDFWSDA
jgi:hypothetical protein